MSEGRFGACLGFTWRPDMDGQRYHVTPGDRGGGTAWGVTFGTFAAWAAAHGRQVGEADLAGASQGALAELVEAWFWMPVRGDALWPGLDLLTFDFGFGSGPGTSVRVLQRVLGVMVDGQVGPRTLAAAAAVDDRAGLLDRLAAAHLGYYRGISGAGGWSRFGAGWARRNSERLAEAQRACSAMLPGPQRRQGGPPLGGQASG